MADFANALIAWGPDPATTKTLLQLTKDLLGIKGSDTSRDADLSMYLEMSGIASEQYIDNIIMQREVTEKLSHSRTPVALKYGPVYSISSILIDGDEKIDDYAPYTDDNLEWMVKGTCDYSVNCCFEQMNITYITGYDPIPADLGYAVVRGAMSYDQESVAGGPMKKETIVGVGSIEYDTTGSSSMGGSSGMLPSSAVSVLDTYKRYRA